VTDPEAYGRLLGWIPRQQDLWRRVRYDALPEEQFGHRLADPRPPVYRPARGLWAGTARILRGPMVRILNVEEALRLRETWGGGAPFAFTLQVGDRDLPQNTGPWRVEFDGARLAVERASGASAAVRLEADIAALSQLYVGELDLASAVRLGGVRVDGAIDPLAALFGPPAGFRLLDEF